MDRFVLLAGAIACFLLILAAPVVPPLVLPDSAALLGFGMAAAGVAGLAFIYSRYMRLRPDA